MMKIEAVDFFYLSMPEVRDVGDGSQDALLVRLQAGGYTGWGECEAVAAGVHRQLGLPHVAQRLQARQRLGAGTAARHG